MRIRRLSAQLVGAAAAVGIAAGVGVATRTSWAGSAPLPELGHFKCYKERIKAGKIARGTVVELTDQFDSHVYAMKQLGLCNPASKAGSGFTDTDTHLTSYAIKPADGLKVTAHLNNEVTDQFGTLRLDTEVRGLRALVPAAKGPEGSSPTDPDYGSHGVNHFVCYPVVLTPGTPKFTALEVPVTDQFGTDINMAVKAVKYLCAPADKVHAGNTFLQKQVAAPNDHLTCYGAKRTKGSPGFVKTLVQTADQIVAGGSLALVTGEELLCNPASKTVCTQAFPGCL